MANTNTAPATKIVVPCRISEHLGTEEHQRQ